MANPVNNPISDFELLGRGFYCTSQIKKSGEIRDSAFYPKNAHDENQPEYFTNKISMVRICRDVSKDGVHQWCDNIRCACKFEHYPNRIFRGFGIEKVSFYKSYGFGVEPAASDENPFHAHLIIPNYKEPYRKVLSVSEILGEERRAMLEELRHKVHYVYCDKDTLPEPASPCDIECK